jgi:hypothetical protein
MVSSRYILPNSVYANSTKGLYAGVVASLSLSCASAIMRNVNYDDLLATANKFATARKSEILRINHTQFVNQNRVCI